MVLGIYGAGGSGKMVVDMTVRMNRQSNRWDDIIFIDDIVGVKVLYGTTVLTFNEMLEKYTSTEIELTITLGEPSIRERLFNKVKQRGYNLATIVDFRANVSPSVKMGEGTIVGNACIGSDVIIGENTMVYENACVGHDTIVGNHNIISALSFVAGHCNVKNKIFVGPSSCIRDNITIEDNAIIALGAAVYRDVEEGHTAIGNPAKYLKHDKDNPLF